MHGFKPAKARVAAQKFADGGAVSRAKKAPKQPESGMVRGPGTGTSDSIPDTVPEGTFIMPADSTQALGARGLSQMGANPDVPVRLSDGEYKLPPDQVHAVGAQVLRDMKDATHKPSQGGAEAPPMFFADGGNVTNDVLRQGNSYSGGNVGGNITINGQLPGGTTNTTPWTGAAPPAPVAAPATPATPGGAPAAPQVATPAPAAPTAPAPAAPMDWAQRNAQRNAGVSAASITNRPEWSRTGAPGMDAPMAPPPASPVNPAVTAPGFGAPKPPTLKPLGYRDGDVVTDEERLRRQTQAYVQGAQAAAATRPAEVPPAPPLATPSKPTVQASVSPSTLYMDDRRNEMAAQAQAGNYAGVVGTGVRTAVQGLGMYGLELADKALSPLASAGQRALGGVLGTDTPDGNVAPPPSVQKAALPPPASTPPAPRANPQASDLSQTTSTAAPAPQQVMPGIYRQGNSYADSAEGLAGSNTGRPSAGNLAAAEALAQRSQQESTGRVAAGFNPQTANVQAPTVRHSGNDWAARNALRNAEVSASSIMNRKEWNRGGVSDAEGKVAGFRAGQAADLALQQAQPGMDQAAMRENAATQRADTAQQSETQRTNTRSALDGRRLDAQQGRDALDAQAKGFDLRQAERMQGLQDEYLAAQGDPKKAAAVAQKIRGLKGDKDSADWRVQVTPATKNADGSTTEGSVIRFNQATGQVERVDGAQGALPPIGQNPKAVAIKNNTSMSSEQKKAALAQLGY